MTTEEEHKAEQERRLRVLKEDRKNFGLTTVEEVEFIRLKKELNQ